VADLTIVLVDTATAVGPPDPSIEYVVLDMAWTPTPGSRTDLRPVRPLVGAIIREHNPFFEALDALDRVAAAADLGRRFMSNGVTWWYHARSALVMAVTERVLWCHLLVDLVRSHQPQHIAIRAERPGLTDAAEAIRLEGPSCSIVVETSQSHAVDHAAVDGRGTGLELAARIRTRLGHLPAAVRRRFIRPSASRPAEDRSVVEFDEAALERRISDMAGRPGAVMAVVSSASFHTVEGVADGGRIDPYVAPILDRLADRGLPVVVVVIGLEMRRSADRKRLAADPRLIPASHLASLVKVVDTSRPDDASTDLPDLRSPDDGFDLGPSLRSMIVALDPWFERQATDMAAAEELIERLKPRVVFTGWEAARTAWLGAARRNAVPSVVVQHGVVYPRSPDYERAKLPGLVRADLTCVFGAYERDLLVDRADYPPESVIVTGSPRIERSGARTPSTVDERERVRAELGIDPVDRMLLLSAGRRFIGDTVYTVEMAGRLLDGPLPGVHIVVKLHPESRDDPVYESLFAGLAAAGGYRPTPVTVVRDVDLYRVLRSADAHLGLYSTVLTDAVLTDTPNMIAMGQAWEDIIGYVQAGVARPVYDVADVRRFMQAPVRADPEDRDRFLDAHYMAGDAAERITTAIVDAMSMRDRS
jgi:hypothetical protein